ncbi:hypothetical protein P5704_024900 (plasmid) [Pseudomonas sp. FeN3W]|nr:hypothetical protein P5704_024900 [Pseudomonas sp. FeN3W]
MTLNELAKLHHGWVASMNWHNRTYLEALAMIASEIGEAADEVTLSGVTSHFALELADVVLRCIDFTELLGLDIEMGLIGHDDKEVAYKPIERCFLDLNVILGKAVNVSRKDDYELLGDYLVRLVAKSFEIAERLGIDLMSAIASKIEINLARGSRGRKI